MPSVRVVNQGVIHVAFCLFVRCAFYHVPINLRMLQNVSNEMTFAHTTDNRVTVHTAAQLGLAWPPSAASRKKLNNTMRFPHGKQSV